MLINIAATRFAVGSSSYTLVSVHSGLLLILTGASGLFQIWLGSGGEDWNGVLREALWSGQD